MQAKFVTVQGVRTRYLHAGAGEAVLLVHGIGLSADCWLRNIGALSGRFAVVVPDILGHGFTDYAEFHGVAPQLVMARHLASLMEALDLPSYSVVGSSLGGLVAALMYLENMGGIRKLGLVGTASAFQSDEDQAKALKAAAANARQALSNPTFESCRRRLEGIVYDPAVVPGEWLWLQLTSYALPDRLTAYEATVNGCIATLGDRNSRAAWRLDQIRIPAWVNVGRDDIRADWRLHSAGAERMPNARLSVYDRCGHLPFLEHADRFNAELIEFLEMR